jgi:probable rRNA maturation factor
MEYQIDVQFKGRARPSLRAAVLVAAETTLKLSDVQPPADLTVLLTDDDEVRALNARFRGEDQPTDVLSFPSAAGIEEVALLGGYWGDIAVSLPYAQRQADEKGHSLEAELQLLVAHGVLHLLGHDHLEPEEKIEMWARQDAVLEALGIPGIRPSEDAHDGEAGYGD